MNSSIVEKKIDKLSPELQKEVIDFIDFLILKNKPFSNIKKNKFNFNWEGGLSDIKNKYSSVELQHKAKDWR